MASKSLGTLTLDLVAKTGLFEAGMDKASRKAKTTSADIRKSVNAIGLGIAAGVTAAAGAVVLMVNQQRAAIDVQAKMAQRLNTTTESLAVLSRAVERTGLSFKIIETAGRTLDISLGKALQGDVAQADALGRLKLRAEELAKLPLDQKFVAINKALSENVAKSERAAVAADLLGSRGAAAIAQLQPEVIAQAAKEIEIFGLNLSDVDAAKVESANDAFSTFDLLGKGIAQRITVELAPALEFMGNEFLRSAEAAGGLEKQVISTVDTTIRSIAYAVDVVDGFSRSFDSAVSAVVFLQAEILELVSGSLATLFGALSNVPGLGWLDPVSDGLREFAIFADALTLEARARIEKNLETPLKGTAFLGLWEDIKEGAEAAAAAGVKARSAADDTGESFSEAAKSAATAAEKAAAALLKTFQSTEAGYAKQIALIGATTEAEKLRYEIASGNLVGINDEQQQRLIALADELDAIEKINAALDAQDAVNVEAASIAEGLKSEEQKLQESYDRQRKIILDSTNTTAKEKAEILTAKEQELTDKLSEINAGYWERYVAALEENLTSLDEVTANTLNNLSQGVGSAFESMIFDAESLDEALYGLVNTIARSMVSAIGEMAAQWLIYQAIQVASGKTTQAAAATTLTANASAMSTMAALNAFSSTAAIPIVGPAAAPAAAAAALAATAPLAATVSTLALAGVAHDGLDAVPQTGTYLLEKGERVTTAETSAKLDRTLSDVQNNQSEGGSSATNLRIVNAFDTQVIGDYMGSGAGEKVIMNAVRRNQRTIQSLSA